MKIRWKDFELPTGVEWDTETLTDTYGRFSIEPFERGFGTTMGHSLRRILISSIRGSAVTALHLEGIRCEFENLEGIVEDTTEIVMNIKNLYIKSHSDEMIVLKLNKKGPGPVRARDIAAHQDVEIMNPDLVLFNLARDITLNMDLEVRKGRGFVLARENMEKAKPSHVDAFTVDSIYSPVHRVSHRVVGTRVGQRTDYERLDFEVWTSGVVTPKEALSEAASIMRKHINPFMIYNTPARISPAEVDEEGPSVESLRDLEDRLNQPIVVLEPSARTRNCLEAEGIQTLRQLVVLSDHDLLKFRNFGQTSLNEIKEKLSAIGLTVGMSLPQS